MSLINEMLKNLEKNAQPAMFPRQFRGLQSNTSYEWRRNKKYYLTIATLLAFLMAVSFIALTRYYITKNHHAENNAVGMTAVAPNTTTAAEVSPSLSLLTGVALQMQHDTTDLRFLLNKNTLYRLSTNVEKNELVIVLEHTHLLAALPKIDYSGSGVKNIQAFSDENDNLKLVLALNPGAELKHLNVDDKMKSPEMQLDIFYRDDMAPVQTAKANAPTIPVTIKNPLVENFADQQYQRALSLSEKNKDMEAITVLKGVLLAFPEYMQAREMLVTLLLKQGATVDANKALVVGLEQQPANLHLIELKARLLVQENKVADAIGLLEKSAPPLVENPGYHAFIAALYERQGQSVLSANLYKQLVTLQPGNAKWWLGLGVALESIGNHGQALEAYANADGAGGLNPELKAYVETQLRG